jgi:hypothetical protein
MSTGTVAVYRLSDYLCSMLYLAVKAEMNNDDMMKCDNVNAESVNQIL